MKKKRQEKSSIVKGQCIHGSLRYELYHGHCRDRPFPGISKQFVLLREWGCLLKERNREEEKERKRGIERKRRRERKVDGEGVKRKGKILSPILLLNKKGECTLNWRIYDIIFGWDLKKRKITGSEEKWAQKLWHMVKESWEWRESISVRPFSFLSIPFEQDEVSGNLVIEREKSEWKGGEWFRMKLYKFKCGYVWFLYATILYVTVTQKWDWKWGGNVLLWDMKYYKRGREKGREK